jgi:hypothetical protein
MNPFQHARTRPIATGADVVLQLLNPLNSDLTPSNLQIVMPDEAPNLIEGF